MTTQNAGKNLPWTLDDVGYAAIKVDQVRDNKDLFYLLASASFVESGADIYAGNLSKYYADHPEVAEWLDQHWQYEEMQHGSALRRYIESVWPEFDWEKGYAGFLQEYIPTCSMDALEPTQALEMVARCVVETGTSSFYRSVQTAVDEPVLKSLAGRISSDEVRHYKYFYKYYNELKQDEKLGRMRVVKAIGKRVIEIKDEDSEIAIRHVLAVERNQDQANAEEVAAVTQRVGAIIRSNFPYDMASKMLMRPLGFNPTVENIIRAPLVGVVKRVLPG